MPSDAEIRKSFADSRENFDELLRRRFVLAPSFEIYGGFGGLYDLGPLGCSLRQRIKDEWQRHFVIHDGMFELDASVITPEPVLQASGHVERFCDLMVSVTDKAGNKQCFRADHVLEEFCEGALAAADVTPERRARLEDVLRRVEEFTAEEIDAIIVELGVKGPGDLPYSAAYPYNLMFPTQLGPTGLVQSYLRPETAQGIFVNFKRFLVFNGNRLPFAVAQQGRSYRNEIAPRSGLIRVREFEQLEIEHFCDYEAPADVAANGGRAGAISDAQMELIADVVLTFNPAETEGTVDLTIREAWDQGLIKNQTLLYYVGRVAQFLYALGIRRDCIRFDQHSAKQLAHYAKDCWDAMILCSYGWVECVGIADRSAFDLECHAKATGENLTAFHRYPEGSEIYKLIIELEQKKLGPAFRRDAKAAKAAVEAGAADEATLAAWHAAYEAGEAFTASGDDGRTFEIVPAMVKKFSKVRQTGVSFTPRVVEPSFGLGRILHCLLEHAYTVRTPAPGAPATELDRAYFSFNPLVAPYKAAILPVVSDAASIAVVNSIRTSLARAGVSAMADTAGSAAIGKRYSRLDELGIPFAVTVDSETHANGSVTVRERDTMRQIRVGSVAEVVEAIGQMSAGRLTWDEFAETHGYIN